MPCLFCFSSTLFLLLYWEKTRLSFPWLSPYIEKETLTLGENVFSFLLKQYHSPVARSTFGGERGSRKSHIPMEPTYRHRLVTLSKRLKVRLWVQLGIGGKWWSNILLILWKVKRKIVSFFEPRVADFCWKCRILMEDPKNNISGRTPLSLKSRRSKKPCYAYHLQIVAQRWHLEMRITGWNHVSHVNIWKSNSCYFEVSETEGS